jgi:hypothetical protein
MNTPEVPRRMRDLPEFKGLPIPFSTYVDRLGVPDFRVNDTLKMERIVKERLCSLCGKPLKLDGRVFCFIGGPKCEENHLFVDGPMHKECARYATKACPFLSNADYSYATHPSRVERAGESFAKIQMPAERPFKMGVFYADNFHTLPIAGVVMFYVPSFKSVDYTLMPQKKMPDPRSEPFPAVGTTMEEIANDLQEMPNNCGICLDAVYGGDSADKVGIRAKRFGKADLELLGQFPGLFHAIGMRGTDTCDEYFQKLEHDHFDFDTPATQQFHLRFFKWNDMMWQIATVPESKRQACFDTATAIGARLQDGIPCCLGGGNPTPEFFPLRGPHVWQLTATKNKGPSIGVFVQRK